MNELQPIEIVVALQKRDLFRSGLLVFRENYKWQFRLAFGLSVLVSIFFLAMRVAAPADERWHFYSFDMVFLLPILVYGFPLFILSTVARSLWRNQPRLKEPTTYLFTLAGIHVQSFAGSSDLNWSLYLKARETRDYFLLYTSPKFAHALPKRCFASEADLVGFRELIRSAIAGPVVMQS